MTNSNAEAQDYNAKLAQDLSDIGGKVKRGMLPLVARNPALERATTAYALSQADHYAELHNPPIALRNSRMMDAAADLVMHEELTWSHPDKMSIVEYPTLSDRQAETRRDREKTQDKGVHYCRTSVVGWRKSDSVNDDGIPHAGRSPVLTREVVEEARIAQFERLYDALANAGLTDRQRQAIELIYYDDLTQEAAAQAMGIAQPNVKAYADAGLRKLREYMTD